MKSLLLPIIFALSSIQVCEGAEKWSKKFEDIVLNELSTQNVLNISVSTRIFTDKDYYNLKNLVSLSSQQQEGFTALLKQMKWHDSLSVSSRSDTEFLIVLGTRNGTTYGLHAANSLESDCFHLVQIELGKESYISNTYFLQTIKKINGQIKPYNRVLKISGWRTTDEGRKILSMVSEYAAK